MLLKMQYRRTNIPLDEIRKESSSDITDPSLLRFNDLMTVLEELGGQILELVQRRN